MSLNSRNAWDLYFRSIGLREELIERHGTYADRLLKAKLPIIFEWHHLAALLGVSLEYVASVTNASECHYRTFSIPKRAGGQRDIEAPRAALKRCQRWILDNILSKVVVSAAAKGFVRRTSIKDHARAHIGSQVLLKMDFENFFPSITKGRVISLFRSLGYSDSVSFYLASFCCMREHMPQGAPTSPAISNIMCRRFDLRLSKLCGSRGWRYTRYADDLAISGKDVFFAATRIVSKIAEDEGFSINNDKTKMYSGSGRKILTGLVLGEEKLSVTRSYRRSVSQQSHYVAKYGLISHVSKTRKRDPLLLDSLLGKVGFWLFVDPDDDRAKRIKLSLEKMRGKSEHNG
ncbi:MAG: retron St85 family RNA-directed DNA polymerase [Pseudomonadota bacterium]